jgi:glycosyltransferase involved in cell wall biosynthesis
VPAEPALLPEGVYVAAVIPAWNEAKSIAPLLVELSQLPKGLIRSIFVADGGSTDGTPEVARARGAEVVIQTRRGYGAACWEGFCAARDGGATHVLFLDGDGADPPQAIPALLRELVGVESGRDTGIQADPAGGERSGAGLTGGAPASGRLVLGVRRVPQGAEDPVPWHARLGNRLVCSLIRLRTGRAVTDLPSMKALAVADLDSLAMREMGFGWTTELIAKSLKRGYPVAEVPITVRPRTAGLSKVSGNPTASARAAIALIRTAITATA